MGMAVDGQCLSVQREVGAYFCYEDHLPKCRINRSLQYLMETTREFSTFDAGSN